MESYNDRRLEIAMLLAKQRGLTWTGLTSMESCKLMQAAETALDAVDSIFG